MTTSHAEAQRRGGEDRSTGSRRGVFGGYGGPQYAADFVTTDTGGVGVSTKTPQQQRVYDRAIGKDSIPQIKVQLLRPSGMNIPHEAAVHGLSDPRP
jgi:hypothetical protein